MSYYLSFWLQSIGYILYLYLFQVVFSESRSAPFILFMKDAEKSIAENGDPISFRCKLDKLPNNVVVIGSQTCLDNRKEKVINYFG